MSDAFDPDAYLATPPVAVPVAPAPPAFDPDAYLASSAAPAAPSPSSFDPDAYLGEAPQPSGAPAGALATFGAEAARTLISLPGEVVKATGIALPNEGTIQEGSLYKMGETMTKYGHSWGATEASKEAHPIAATAGGIVGGFGAAAPAIGAAVVGAPLTALGLGLGAGAVFAGSAAANSFDEALLMGADESAAAKAAGLNALVSGSLGLVPLGAVLAPVRAYTPGLTGWAATALEKAARGGVVFTTVGEAQEFLGRQIAKSYYDPNAGYSPDVNRLLGGLIGGGIIGAVTPTMLHKNRNAPVTDETLRRAGLGITQEEPPPPPPGPDGVPMTPKMPPPDGGPAAARFEAPRKPVIEPELASLAELLPMAEEIEGKTGINQARAMAIVGTKMYGDPSTLPETSVKEFMQNSFDAVKVLPSGIKGKIDITVDPEQRTVSIIDNGRGMAPEILAGPFLEAATSHKETAQSSGRFGLAKLLTLYENEEIHVVTMRDNIVSRLDTTGEIMKASVEDTRLRPKIRYESFEKLPVAEQREVMALLPEGRGTAVSVKVPSHYADNTGALTQLRLSEWGSDYKVLRHSPLFADIDVSFNGVPVRGIGSRFPKNEYTQLFNVKFPHWGTARVYISRTPEKVWSDNLHILSNGIWQFSGDLKINPSDSGSGLVPHQLYVDLDVKAGAESRHYPFDLNRQQFAQNTGKEFGKLFNYISKLEQYKGLQSSSTSYGLIQYLEWGGKTSEAIDMAPAKPGGTTALNRLKEGDDVTIKEGKLIVNGKEIPELTEKDLTKMNFDVASLTIPQSQISSTKPMIHNNVELKVPSAGPDEYMPITTLARQMWGERFDQYLAELGYKFIDMRDQIVDIMVEEGQTRYKQMSRSAIGLTIDEKMRGVSITIPFEASFLNPARPMFTQGPRAGASFYDTMIHELAHYFNRNHSSDFRDEMKKFYIILDPYREHFYLGLQDIATRYNDVIGGLNELLNTSDKRTVGNRLRDASPYEARDDGRVNDVSSVGSGGRSADRLFARSAERPEPPERLSNADRMAEEITGIVPEPPPEKGFRGYHGSPFDFLRFDIGKRGTGEGNATFSPGIYIGENVATGKRYQDTTAMYFYNGQPYDARIPQHRAALLMQERGRGGAVEYAEQSASRATLGKAYEQVAAIDAAAAKVLRSGEELAPLLRRGNLYTVEVRVPKEHFLDWDTPLRDQPELLKKIQKIWAREDIGPPPVADPSQFTGGAAYERLATFLQPEGATKALLDAGIPGIKYLDAGSRNAAGERTRNFVVYDESLVDVTHKNEQPIAPEVQRAIHDVQQGAEVVSEHGRTIVNGHTVDNISPDEMQSFAPIGVPPKAQVRDGYAANDKAMRDAGVTDFPRTPVTDATGGGRNMLTGLFGSNPPPGARAAAVAADHFVQKLRWLWDFRALVDANPHLEPLQRHAIIEDHQSNEATQRQVLAEDTLRAAWKLGGDEKKAVYRLIDDYMNARYMSEAEKQKTGLLRKPTTVEFNKLVKDSGVNDHGLKVFTRMTRDFEKFVRDMMENLRAEALELEPQKMAKELSRIDSLEKDLLDRPYFPATRYGLFSVLIQGPEGPRFYRTETKRQQQKLMKELKKTLKPGETMTDAKLPVSSLPFQGLPVHLLEVIEKKMLPQSKEAEELRNAISQLKYESSPIKGITSRVANRILTPGYSHDFFRNYANFFYHGSRYLARHKYQRDLKNSLQDLWDSVPGSPDGTKRSEIAQFVQDRYERNLDPRGDWAMTRAFMFHMALGFRVSSAATNLTQTFISTYPHLASEFGDVRAIAAMTKAGADWRNFYRRATAAEMSDTHMKALHELMMLGRIRGALAPELAGLSEGRNFLGGYGGSKVQAGWTQLLKMSSGMFELTEQMNRRVAGMATFELALRDPKNKFVQRSIANDPQLYAEMKAKGFNDQQSGAIVAAKVMIDRTQYQYSREYRPAYLSGPIGSTVGMFKLFTHRMLWNLYNYPAAGMRTLLIFGFLGGLQGIPGFVDLNGILKAIGTNFFGKDFDLEDEARRFAVDVLGMKGTGLFDDPFTVTKGFASRGYGIPAMADFIGEWAGVGKIPIPELDRGAAVSLNNILPIDFGAMFGPQAAKNPGDAFAQGVSRGMGAFGSYAYNTYKALMNMRESPESLKRWERVAPVFLSGMSHAARVYAQGAETSQTGSRIVRFDPHDTEHMMEVVAMGLGYTPFRLSREWTRIRAEREAVAFWEMRKEMLLNQYWGALTKKDPEDRKRVVDAIRNYNKEVKGTEARGMVITAETIERSMQSRQSAKQKQEAGIPKSEAELPLIRGIRRLFPGAEVQTNRVR